MGDEMIVEMQPKCSSAMCLIIFVLFYFQVFFLKLTLRVNRGILLALVCFSFNGAQLTEKMNLKITWKM